MAQAYMCTRIHAITVHSGGDRGDHRSWILELPCLGDVRLLAICQHLLPDSLRSIFPQELLVVVVLLPVWFHPPATAAERSVHFGLAQDEDGAVIGEATHGRWSGIGWADRTYHRIDVLVKIYGNKKPETNGRL